MAIVKNLHLKISILEEVDGVVLPRPQPLPARGAAAAAVETRGQTRLAEHVAAHRGDQPPV